MAKYVTKEINNKQEWEKYVLGCNPRSFLQSWNWGETNKLQGDKVIRLGFYEGKNLRGICLLIKQEAKRGVHFLVPGGPLIDWKNKKLAKYAISEIRRLAKENGAWFVRVRPEILDSSKARASIRQYGFVRAPIHLHAENTWVLNIDKSEEELLAGMRKNTRYSVRKSLEEGLNVRKSTDPKKTKILARLQKATVKRHGFVGFKKSLFTAQIETFGRDNQAALFLIDKNKKPLVAAIIIFYGDYSYYHHSSSSEMARKTYASYLLQWEVMREAKKRGCKYYNLWGIAPSDNPKHRFYGVSVFKKGFGGKKVDWLHAHDIVISPKYWTTFAFETLRRVFRKL